MDGFTSSTGVELTEDIYLENVVKIVLYNLLCYRQKVWTLQVFCCNHSMKRDDEGCICFSALHPLQAGQHNTGEQHWQCPLYHVRYTIMLICEADVV